MSTRGLIVSGIVAAVTVSSAIYVVATTGSEPIPETFAGGGFVGDGTNGGGFEFSPETTPAPTASPDAPESDWSLTVSAVSDAVGAGFYDPVSAGEMVFRGPGFIEVGDLLVTIVGVPSDSEFELTDASFVALDRAEGSVRWTAPADTISGCASNAVDGKIVCHSGRYSDDAAIVSVDAATGELVRTQTDWSIEMLDSIDERLYVVEGDVEGSDLRVHSGTPSDPAAYWTSQLSIGGYGEDSFMFVLSLDHGIGYLDTQSDAAIFDLGTGAVPWQKTSWGDCVDADTVMAGGIVIVHPFECETFEPTSTEALDSAGRVLARSDDLGAHRITLDASDLSAPFLLGDSAFDRGTGEKMWTASVLLADNGEGTAVAVIGHVALWSNGYEQTMGALDLRTGEELWSKPGFVNPSASNGDVVAGIVNSNVTALDIETGDGWTLPISLIGNGEEIFDGSETVRSSDGTFVYASTDRIVALTG